MTNKTRIVSVIISIIVLGSCVKTRENVSNPKNEVKEVVEPTILEMGVGSSQEENSSELKETTEIILEEKKYPLPLPASSPKVALEELEGKWLFVGFDGLPDENSDYFEVQKEKEEYLAVLQYQGYMLPGRVHKEDNDIYFFSRFRRMAPN